MSTKNIQTTFLRIEELKKKKRDIEASLKDELDNSAEYQDVKEKIKKLQQRKRDVEDSIKSKHEADIAKIERYKKEIAEETDKLGGMALTQIAKGENIVVTDSNEKTYDPVLSVKFKKSETQQL